MTKSCVYIWRNGIFVVLSMPRGDQPPIAAKLTVLSNTCSEEGTSSSTVKKGEKNRVTSSVWLNWVNFSKLLLTVVKSPPSIGFFLRCDWSPNHLIYYQSEAKKNGRFSKSNTVVKNFDSWVRKFGYVWRRYYALHNACPETIFCFDIILIFGQCQLKTIYSIKKEMT